MTIPEKAVQWALSIANDNSHGYDQGNRWGPDYDCSSLVISAFKQAGLPLQSTYTGNMKRDFLNNGFVDITSKVNLATGSGLERGDVLLHEIHHTGLYIGDGMMVEATGNERGGVTGGKTGDQTSKEIAVNRYHNYGSGWNCVLRYSEENQNGNEQPTTIDETYVVKQGDSLWYIATLHNMDYIELAKINNLDPDGYIFPGQVLKIHKKHIKETEPDDIYVVEQGDSLWWIAHKKLGKGWKWWRIAEANNLSAPYIIHPGQRLKIPKDTGY